MPPKPGETLSSTNTSDTSQPAQGDTSKPARLIPYKPRSYGGPIIARMFLGAALAVNPELVSTAYGRQRIFAESSTGDHEVDPYLVDEIFRLLEGGAYEFFQDGIESAFSRTLLQMIRKHGRDALDAIADYVFSSKVKPDVASETLRRIGDVDDESTLGHRWYMLQNALKNPSPKIRDGAILGFAALDDPHATDLLNEARGNEQIHELQVLIDQVVNQLERNR